MKDPLHTEQTAYDILALAPGADNTDVTRAFKLGIVNRGDAAKLQKARKTLLSPDERFMLDFLYYDPDFLARMNPNPIEDDSALRTDKRPATAKAWEAQMKKTFPEMGSIHCLAIFWYWWAMNLAKGDNGEKAGQKKGGAETTGKPDLPYAWKRVVAFWVTLSRNLGSMPAAHKPASDLRAAAALSLEKKLQSDFHSLGQTHRYNQQTELVELYREMDLHLKTESMTAGQIRHLGIQAGDGPVVCGRLMLELVGQLKMVNNTIEEKLKKTPDDEDLLKLRTALSEHSAIAVLIARNKPDEALQAIDKLKANEKRLKKVKDLKARAMMVKGEQQADLNHHQEALLSWYEALDYARDKQLKADIAEKVVTFCQRTAAELKTHRRDDAINLLKEGVAVVKDDKLSRVLGDLLTERGIENFNKAHKASGHPAKPVVDEIMNSMEQAVEDLRQAAKLGSKRAAEQLEGAETTFKMFRFKPELDRANKAAEKEDWDTAIENLEAAMKKAGSDVPDVLKTNFAVCLYNRAVKTVIAAQKSNAPRDELIAAIENGLSDLRRSAELNHKEAKEQIRVFNRLLQNVKQSFERSDEVQKAAERKDWSTAIDILERALPDADRHNREQLEKTLSVFYNNRGIDTLNRFIQAYQQQQKEAATQGINPAISTFLASAIDKAGGTEDCAVCGKSKRFAHGESWLAIGEGSRRVMFCEACSPIVNQMLSELKKSTKVGNYEKQLLEAAYGDLLRALDKDKDNAAAKKSIEDLKEMYAKLELSLPMQTVAKAAAAKMSKKASARAAKKKTIKKKRKRAPAPAGSPRNVLAPLLAVMVFAVLAVIAACEIYQLTDQFVLEWLPPAMKGLIPLAMILVAGFGFKYVWQQIGRRRWNHKTGFQKFAEVALFSTIAIVAGYLTITDQSWQRLKATRMIVTRMHWFEKTDKAQKTETSKGRWVEEQKKALSIIEQNKRLEDFHRRSIEASEALGNQKQVRPHKSVQPVEVLTSSQKAGRAGPVKTQPSRLKNTIYKVRPGDTLSAICRRHGLSLEELCRINNIEASDVIVPGQELVVKKAGS